ncbi:MAG: tRNA (adenosine(37)-N6)-threonylcarbamoyltransferase complex ATPase subunit type 1 TsaE [Pseudomonadota bacterium]
MPDIELEVPEVADMEALGGRLAASLGKTQLIYVHGPLGAGKTTLVRGMLHALGHVGAVKSPTFTLVEPYELRGLPVYHFDLYRLNDPEELEFLGMRDYLHGEGVCVVEWAERAQGVLPAPDIDVMIQATEKGRMVRIAAHTDNGNALLSALA